MIDWHFPRHELAERYLAAFDTGITGALALFAPRRMGKTEFVLLDLAPVAEVRGYNIAYCSFWNLQDNPARALRISLDEISNKSNWKQKWASYIAGSGAEISAAVAGASFKISGDGVKSTPPQDELLAIIESLGKLATQKQKTLLLLDEVQHLANDAFAPLVATLRTQFELHRNKIHVVFTGSSRDGLQRMFRDRKAPMFHAAQQVDFPQLDSRFVAFMINAFRQASNRTIDLAPACRIFTRMQHSPAMFHQLLRHMVLSGIWDIEEGYKHFSALVDVGADYAVLWADLKEADRTFLRWLARDPDAGVYSEAARSFMAEEMGLEEVTVKTVQNSIERLRRHQVLYSYSQGQWVFEDSNLKNWILQQDHQDST